MPSSAIDREKSNTRRDDVSRDRTLCWICLLIPRPASPFYRLSHDILRLCSRQRVTRGDRRPPLRGILRVGQFPGDGFASRGPYERVPEKDQQSDLKKQQGFMKLSS